MNVLSKLAKFASKEYRDGFMQTQVRGGIAYQIKALREKFGLTQTQFAEVTGKKQSVVSRLEDTEYGKVTVQTLLDIASSLNVALLVRFISYPEFLTRTENMTVTALQPETISESLNNYVERTTSLANPEIISQGSNTINAAKQHFNLKSFPGGSQIPKLPPNKLPPMQKGENKFLMVVH